MATLYDWDIYKDLIYEWYITEEGTQKKHERYYLKIWILNPGMYNYWRD